MPGNLDQIFLTVLALWLILVCVRIFWATQLKSFLLIGVSFIFILLSISVYSRVTDTILKAISQFLFWGGVLWLGTFERGRLNQLRNMSLKEYLSKNGAKKQTNNEPGILIFENHLFSSLSFVLLAVAIGNHYFFQARFRENLPLLITALLFIIYNMGRKRG